jgi:hypothetical protein
MPEDDVFAKGYLKGYEEGLKDAWEELISLTMKGYTSREIQILAKSRKSDIPQRIVLRKRRLAREMDIDLDAAPKVHIKEEERTTAPPPDADSKPLSKARTEETPLAYEPGSTVIIRDKRLERPLAILMEETAKGRAGLCILRTPPEAVRKKHAIDCSMVWLTKTEGVKEEGGDLGKKDAFVSPTDLPKLTTMIKSFSTENKGGVVVLEGLEYLVTQNDFKGVLKFLSTVRDQVYLAKAMLLLPIDPSIFEEKDLKALEREGGEE